MSPVVTRWGAQRPFYCERSEPSCQERAPRSEAQRSALQQLVLINFRPQTGKVANVILAGTGDDSDDAEEFLVEEKPKDQLDLIAEASANTTQADVSKLI